MSQIVTPAAQAPYPLSGVGLGLRHAHYPDFLEKKQPVDWLEVHSENYFSEGGYDRHVLMRLREDYPVSLHGVGLGIGSADPLSLNHLEKLRSLIRQVQPAAVSEHLCWNAAGGVFANELLPLPMRRNLLGWLTDRVDQVQNFLGCRIALENVSSYVRFQDADMTEAEFLTTLARRSGCGVLLDINNLYVSQWNHNVDARAELMRYLALPPDQITEIHLAGHQVRGELLFDTHDAPLTSQVLELYRFACLRGAASVPVMIERDADIPPLSDLLSELQEIRKIRSAAGGGNAES